ncbi:hypothetical protein E1264_34060 [Actinomadura sp. KC216]|uniref:hypothetical protein n=1 Tax=Actinomadura sp. KC216 TaxID=2530370 RepID=UPI00104C10A7|nr:hypothetical protein [Actinomadura sp. KC216]TDB80502.1 hypothetical protein E1264_34060 [Actinomadura sp. KC216]
MRSFAKRALVAPVLAVALAGGAPATATAQDTGKKATVNLIRLVCYETEDTSGGDEIYIMINGSKVWSIADSINCDHSNPSHYPINHKAQTGDQVSLFDKDGDFPGDADDHLGSDIIEGDRGSLVFNLDDALYTIDYGPA